MNRRTLPLLCLLSACVGRPDPGGDDGEAPTVVFTAPAAGAEVAALVELVAEAEDPDGIASVAFTVDGAALGEDLAAPWSWSWDSTTVPNGAHRIEARATDGGGASATASLDLTVTNEGLPADAVRITSPLSGAALCGVVPVTVDAAVEVERVEFFVDGVSLSVDTSAPFSADWNTVVAANGAHVIRALGTAAEGQQAQDQVEVTAANDAGPCDNPPSVEIETPVEGAYLSGTVPVQVRSADVEGGTTVELRAGPTLLAAGKGPVLTVDWDTAALPEGEHTLSALAADEVGQENEHSIVVQVDHSPPTVWITEPLGGAMVEGELPVAVDAEDGGSLSGVELFLSGGSLGTLLSPPFQWSVDLAAVPHGSTSLRAVATDAAGNSAESEILVFVNEAPVVTITGPGALVTDADSAIAATVTDDTGVASVRFFVDGVLLIEDLQAPWLAGWDHCAAGDGPHLIEVEATDLDGVSAIAASTTTVALQDLDADLFDLCLDCDDSDPGLTPDDGDGDGLSTCQGDCDDTDALRVPGAVETCDGFDSDCGAVGQPFLDDDEVDDDADGVLLCVPDCDDLAFWNFPGNTEVCDGVDNDCDGAPAASEIELTDGLDNDCDGLVDQLDPDWSPVQDTASWTVEGGATGVAFGSVVAGLGDLNDDGFDDFGVGVPYASNGQNLEGIVYVFSGASGGPSVVPTWTLEGGQAEAAFGAALAGGDVDGDGYADLVVGAPGWNTAAFDAGRAALFLGGASGPGAVPAWERFGSGLYAELGAAVVVVAEHSTLGHGDVVVGAPGEDGTIPNEGVAERFAGGPLGLGAAPAWTGFGGQHLSEYGAALSSVGDFDGDGFGDFVVGSPGWSNGQNDEGRVVLEFGGPSGPAWPALAYESGQQGAALGSALGAGGDVDGDGFRDFLAGAPLYDVGPVSDLGTAWLFLGGPLPISLTTGWTLPPGGTAAASGTAVAVVGDTDGDGFSEVAVGSPERWNGESWEGTVHLYVGGSSGPSTAAEWVGDSDQVGAHCGAALAPAGDVDGDGKADLLVGTPQWDNGHTNEGRAELYLGR